MRIAALSILAITSLSACALPQGGDGQGAFRSSNDLWAHSTGPDSFRVDPGTGPADGAASYWCAASEYAMQALHKDGTVRLYRTSAPPRAAGKGVDFSFSPENVQRSGVIRIGGHKRGFTVGAANAMFCPDPMMTPFG